VADILIHLVAQPVEQRVGALRGAQCGALGEGEEFTGPVAGFGYPVGVEQHLVTGLERGGQ